ncbi:ATP-binding cassette domain-containing protein [Clostridium sp. Marseille-Q2269]|uniref:ATP-binding cassette domain-containing protein n=1 Tax=Clostridium sp. Marseille-Q2269 TaxID=2942205 RepID=UPI00255D02C8|nr:ATP-binding cassette domain-containing protein [Clostridium sp. Marseille-Q2269]
MYTLLGENGSGKTTLIKIMTTLLKQNSGNVMISGYDVKKNPEKIRENISLNAQSTTVDELFSGYENMSLIAQLRGVKNPKEEIEKLSKRFDLSDFLMRKGATYSGGMRRRLDIAMSLMGDPEIIQ